MAERKLKRGRRERDAVALADGLHLRDLGEDLGRGRG